MKYKNILLPLFSLALAGSAFASDSAKVPFMNKAVPDDGLYVNYIMHGQKVVCVFDNFYKGSFTYMVDGRTQQVGAFGDGTDGQEFIFSTKGGYYTPNEQLSYIQTDPKSFLKVQNTPGGTQPATASCFYIPDYSY